MNVVGEVPLSAGDDRIDDPEDDRLRRRIDERIQAQQRHRNNSCLRRFRQEHYRHDKSPTAPIDKFPKKSSFVIEELEHSVEQEATEREPKQPAGSNVPTTVVPVQNPVDEDDKSKSLISPTKNSRSHSCSKETDFYRNPTLLSRLILHRKYKNAIQRVQKCPEEANVWVCVKRHASTGKELLHIRQLPIHIATSCLGQNIDSYKREQLHELISTLIFTDPVGAHEEDHRNRLPLHEAIWYGAPANIISLFLIAKPEAIRIRDSMGRSLTDMNQFRIGRLGETESIQHLLDRGLEFWQTAQQEAKLRLKHHVPILPSSSQSISSMSVLASSEAQAESIVTTGTEPAGAKMAIEEEEKSIDTTTWSQLEQRAILNEQLLAEVHEKNYLLIRKVQALTTIDQIRGEELVQELIHLQEENKLFAEKLRKIQRLLSKVLRNKRDRKQFQMALAEISSVFGASDRDSLEYSAPVLPITQDALKMHHALQRKHCQQREKIRKIMDIIEIMVQDATSSSETGSTLSPLTHPSATLSDVDDLQNIFRLASARDMASRLDLQPIQNKLMDVDDLSKIFQWAASNEIRDRNYLHPSLSSSWSPDLPTMTMPNDEKQNLSQRDLHIPALLGPP